MSTLPRVMTAAQFQEYHRTGRIDAKEVSTPKKAPSHTFGQMNGLETRFSYHLEGLRLTNEIKYWLFEKITLRLADRTTFTPDFFAKHSGGNEINDVFYEVKGGFERDDSRVKRKVAAQQFRGQFRIVLVLENAAKNGWEEREL